ncbi:MAG TPA: radical SAM protein [Chloroflexi bacterium]|nr:radical SAM protein [Chloroflexota bacterium]
MLTFGPVPSRRLGRSLGINHIPAKICTYSCVYCQVGRTLEMRIERKGFHDPAEIEDAVRERLARLSEKGVSVDYLTFVPDGEPTLDIHLGQAIARLKPLGIKVAVITNGSLIWRQDVRTELMQADWVSLKVDSVEEEVWHRVDRPHGALRLDSILEGMLTFARAFDGELVTETMLVRELNDRCENLVDLAAFLARLGAARAYLAVPTRPPAESWVQAPDEDTLNQAYQILRQEIEAVELLTGYEGDAFASTGDAEVDLLGITAVHPMREESVRSFISRAGADWSLVRRLIEEGRLVETEYDGAKFYLRRFSRSARN